MSATTGPEFHVLGWAATAHQEAVRPKPPWSPPLAESARGGAPWTATGAQLGLSGQGAQEFLM